MAYLLLLLTLLLLSLLPVVSSGNASTAAPAANQGQNKPAEDKPTEDKPTEDKPPIIVVSPFPAPNEKRKKIKVKRSTKRGLSVTTVRCAGDAVSGHVEGGCFLAISSELSRNNSPRTKIIVEVYDLENLRMVQRSLATNISISFFYIRCMERTYYDDRNANCRGGPERSFDPDRFIKEGYHENGAIGFEITRGEDFAFYYGDIKLQIDVNKIEKIENNNQEIDVEGTSVEIVKHSDKLILKDNLNDLDRLRTRDFNSIIVTGSDNAAAFKKVEPENETFPVKLDNFFDKQEENKTTIRFFQSYYLTPFINDEIKAGPDTVTYVVRFFPIVYYPRRLPGDNFNVVPCRGEGSKKYVQKCFNKFVKVFEKQANLKELAIYVVSTDLSTLEAFAEQVNIYKDGYEGAFPPIVTPNFPMLFLKKAMPFWRRLVFKGILGYPKFLWKLWRMRNKKGRQKNVEARNRKTIADFNLATFSSSLAFEGSLATEFDDQHNNHICWYFILKYNPKNWKIEVDGEELPGQSKDERSVEVVLQWRLGSFIAAPFKGDLRYSEKHQQPEGASKLSIVSPIDGAGKFFKVYCNESKVEYEGGQGFTSRTFILQPVVIATNRFSKKHWSDDKWAKRPEVKKTVRYILDELEKKRKKEVDEVMESIRIARQVSKEAKVEEVEPSTD